MHEQHGRPSSSSVRPSPRARRQSGSEQSAVPASPLPIASAFRFGSPRSLGIFSLATDYEIDASGFSVVPSQTRFVENAVSMFCSAMAFCKPQ